MSQAPWVAGQMLSRKSIAVAFLAALPGAIAFGRSQASHSLAQFPNPAVDVGGNASSIASADFNGDHEPDLVVAVQSYIGFLAVLLGKKNGTFGEPVTIEIGGEVKFVLARDLNRDRKDDLLVMSDYQVQLFAGKGDGTFLDPVVIDSEEGPLGQPAAGDLNADRIPDVVIPVLKSGLVKIFFGQKDGSFSPGPILTVGMWPWSAACGDFDGDGKGDIAVFNQISCDISLFPATGKGAFGPEIRIPSGITVNGCEASGHSLISVDLNNDHKDDLAVSSQSSGEIVLFLAGARGRFGAPTKFGVGSTPSPLWAGDIDGNGTWDLAVANYSSDDVAILLGRRDGTFSTPVRVPVGAGPTSVVFADLNHDGTSDLAAAFRVEAQGVHLFLGNGDGSYGPAIHPVAGRGISALVLGQFDGDGHLDAAVAGSHSQQVLVLPGQGNVTFGDPIPYEVGWNPTALASGDFDGDGREDLAVAVRDFDPFRDGPLAERIVPMGWRPPPPPRGFVVLLLQRPEHPFTPVGPFPVGWNPSSLKAEDLNGDGKLDLLVLNDGAPQFDKEAGISVLLGNGNGTFETEIRRELEQIPASVASGDFDSDGRPDLVVLTRGRPPRLSLLRGMGDGRFGDQTLIEPDDLLWCFILGDVDSDGRPDILLGRRSGPYRGPLTDSRLTLLLGQGNGTFSRMPLDPGLQPISLALGDVNGDARVDLVALGTSGEVSVLIGQGNARFLPAARFSPAGRATLLAEGDLDGDGREDLTTVVPGGISVLMSCHPNRRTFPKRRSRPPLQCPDSGSLRNQGAERSSSRY